MTDLCQICSQAQVVLPYDNKGSYPWLSVTVEGAQGTIRIRACISCHSAVMNLLIRLGWCPR